MGAGAAASGGISLEFPAKADTTNDFTGLLNVTQKALPPYPSPILLGTAGGKGELGTPENCLTLFLAPCIPWGGGSCGKSRLVRIMQQ